MKPTLTRKQMIDRINKRFKKAGLPLKLDHNRPDLTRKILLDMYRQLEDG